MRYYEAIFSAQPNLEQNELSLLVGETKSMLEKRGGELLYEELMGKRRLAYPIKKHRFGTYVLLQFQGDGTGNARLNQDLELKDDILAHMIVRIDKEDIREARIEALEDEQEISLDEEPVIEGEGEPSGVVDDEPEREESETELKEAPPDEQSPPHEEEDLGPDDQE